MALLNVKGAVYVHDPEIVKENGVYYRFCTGNGIPVAKSRDLFNWEECEPVFKTNPLWTSKAIPGSNSLWAPDITWHNGDSKDEEGEWRLYYSVSTFGSQKSAIGLCVNKTLDSSSPDFCWKDLGCVIQSDNTCNYNAIDPAVFSDKTGNDFLLFGSFWGGLMAVPLTPQGFVVKDAAVKNIATRHMEPNAVEGGYIFYHQNYYYLFASYDFCCRGTASSYHIVCGRSENPLGPYTDMFGKSFLDGGGDTLRDSFSFERWAGPGHNSFFKDDDGKIYLVYHAYDRTDDGKSVLQIEEMNFEEGFPVLKD